MLRTSTGRRAKNAWALEERSSPALAAVPATRGSQRASDGVTSQGRPTKFASSAPIAITASYHLALRDFKLEVGYTQARQAMWMNLTASTHPGRDEQRPEMPDHGV